MLDQTPNRMVRINKLGPDSGWAQVDAADVARTVHLTTDPSIVIAIFYDGRVVPITERSAEDAGLVH